MAKPEPDETGPASGRPDSRADRIEPTLHSTRHVLRTVLLYGVFGPPIGAFLIILGSLSSRVARDGVTGVLLKAIYVVEGWIYYSYILALVPSLITGYFVGRLPRRWTALWFAFCAGLIGALVSFGWFGLREMELPGRPIQDMLLMPLLGGFSAGTLALALRCIPRPHPNPSA